MAMTSVCFFVIPTALLGSAPLCTGAQEGRVPYILCIFIDHHVPDRF